MMQWLFIGLVEIIRAIAAWFIRSGFRKSAVFLTYITTIIALFVAFVGLIYLSLNAVLMVAPAGVGFGLSLLPDSTPLFFSSYLTALIAKRVFDWYHHFSRDMAKIAADS